MTEFTFDYDACSAWGEGTYNAKDWNSAIEGIADYVAWKLEVDDEAEVTITHENGETQTYLVCKHEENNNGQTGNFSASRI